MPRTWSGSAPRDAPVATLLAALVFATHLASPIRTSFDSRWSIHTAVSLAYRGDADLEEYVELLKADDDYAVEWRAGRRFTRFPIGPSLLALPVVVAYDTAARVLGWPSSEDLIRQKRAALLEVLVASLVVALTTALIFLIGRECSLGTPLAAALALIFAFCTPAWSTASRGLWQHGPAMLASATALYLFLLARRREVSAALAGVALALGVVMRPTGVVPLAVIAAYVALRHPRQLPAFLLLAAVVLGAFVAANLWSFGAILPSYFRPGGQPVAASRDVPWALLGHLVSPNRGLLVFSPVLVLAPVGVLVKAWGRRLDLLDAAAVSTVAAHLLVISFAGQWWAGHSYGPRFSTDVLPLLAYLMIPALALVGARDGGRRVPLVSLGVVGLLVAWSFFAHYRAATTWDVWAWNGQPINVDERPERAWDWSDMQILRGLGG
ncbi:MAG TPA: hypothetical protein VIS07_21245 [Candidatus Binatia bacterium]